jgi:hypothetical protein
MSLVLLGSTSGSVTLQEPAIAGSTVIDLPATSGTMAVLPTATSVLPEASGGTGTTTGYYGFKNRIINGAMVIDQRNAGASVTVPAAAIYTVDRWAGYGSQASKITIQQNAGSVTPPSGFSSYLGVTVGASANVTIGASDLFQLYQPVEGFNASDLAWGTASAVAVTLSFWVRSSLTGTFSGSVYNNNGSYVFTFAIAAANTWEQKTITIPANTTYAIQSTTSGSAFTLNFDLGAGSNWTATANSFAGPTKTKATGSTNLVTTNGATFYITGVQLEKGSTATSFDYRPIGTELALCQRYYQRYGDATTASTKFVGGLGSAVISTEFDLCFTMPVAMRSSPTMNYANLQIVDGAGGAFTPSSITTYQATTTTAGLYLNATGMTAFRPYFLRSSAGYLDASSEL